MFLIFISRSFEHVLLCPIGQIYTQETQLISFIFKWDCNINTFIKTCYVIISVECDCCPSTGLDDVESIVIGFDTYIVPGSFSRLNPINCMYFYFYPIFSGFLRSCKCSWKYARYKLNELGLHVWNIYFPLVMPRTFTFFSSNRGTIFAVIFLTNSGLSTCKRIVIGEPVVTNVS